MLLQIKTAYPSFDVNEAVLNMWNMFLLEADAEMAFQNLKDHVKTSPFVPTIHDIVKVNEDIRMKREKEATQRRLQEQQLMIEASTTPPWVKEGITQREWMARILEGRAKQ